MIRIEKNLSEDKWELLRASSNPDQRSARKTVKKILKTVKNKGDKAIRQYTSAFDGVKIKDLQVEPELIVRAGDHLGDDLKKSIHEAKKNISNFHSFQKEEAEKIEIDPGIECWRFSSPIQKIGLYVPGGTAPLFSTILMLAIPARLAGCDDIILCTPPGKSGNIHPAILYTAGICGIKTIFKIGGAQAIAAMAYGTRSIQKVDKIFGPGNQYVTIAKQLVQMEGVAIDMPAGPSELMVVADNTGIASFIAADLLSQCEHGAGSQVIFATNDEGFAQDVAKEVSRQEKYLSRINIIKQALKNSYIIVLDSLEQCMKLANQYAPEHLILAGDSAHRLLPLVISAGSVFLGNYSPESAGDYATGTNHTLPTNGYARAYSGVSVDSFVKKITVQELSKAGLQRISHSVITMAEAEHLDAHSKAISIRLNQLNDN